MTVPAVKTPGSSTGTINVKIDGTDPLTCADATVTTGPLTVQSFNVDHDEDGDTCTDYEELGGSTDPFNPYDCPLPPITENLGSVGGVTDIVVGVPQGNPILDGIGVFYCIAKTDHQASDNQVQTFLQCNVDAEDGGVAQPDPEDAISPPTWHDTCEALAVRVPPECISGDLRNPSEGGPDALNGPPPPPPYTIRAPSIGRGYYYPGGAGAPGGLCGGTDCTVTTVCFEDTGPILGSTGPNVIWRYVVLDPNGGSTVNGVNRVSTGSVDIWYNQNNANCNATPIGTKGLSNLSLPLQSIQAYDKGPAGSNPNPAPWRPGPNPGATVTDFDGDGCTDEQELAIAPPSTHPSDCGDDPQNPSDSFTDPDTVDLSGIYDLLVTVVPGDCTDTQCTAVLGAPFGGLYLFCRADLQHNSNPNVVLRPYCYWDSTAYEINPEAYPVCLAPTCGPIDVYYTGDSMAGAPPPGPQAPAGTLNFAFGDVDTAHAELSGTFNKTTHNFEFSGCIQDLDGKNPLGNVWIEFSISAHQLPSTIDIWVDQPAQCAGSPTFQPPTFNDGKLSMVQSNPAKGKGYDSDNDGVPDAKELEDDAACGRRDPFNPYDYYDVSIPRDGVIDLANDILGVINHFTPGGYPSGDENWDRPPTMTGAGAGSIWNRGSPDGVIDLPNDILGVIGQFNPGGCPPP